MQTWILPGFSAHNRTWSENVASNLKIQGQIRPVFWSHWGDSLKKFDPAEKASLIIRHTKDQQINIIAKSIGTLVSSLVVSQIPGKINKVIFCGIPQKDLSLSEFELVKKACFTLDKKILIFQNDNDPHAEIEVFKDFPNLIIKTSNSHDYPYYSDFSEFLKKI